jgi:hypothetical protein
VPSNDHMLNGASHDMGLPGRAGLANDKGVVTARRL